MSTLAGLPAIPDYCTVILADVSRQIMPDTDARLLLSSTEADRAATFRLPVRRMQYEQCHALLRVLLSRRVGVDADQLSFCKGEFDKPALCGEAAESGITFNLSHTGSLVAIAISNDVDVGVDIEQVTPGRSTLDIAEHFFAPAEQQAIRALPCSEQDDAFYSCWSRKESFIKATGLGLRIPLDKFAVNVEPTAAAELLWIDYPEQQLNQWQMHTLLTPAGCFGALTLGTRR